MADNFVTLPALLKILDGYDHKEFHVHHTWKPEHRDFNGKNQRALQNGMRNYHMRNNGWGDIAQHITVFPDGSILTGRGFSRTPISIQGKNTGGFMMEMVANFDVGHDKFEGKQKEVAIEIARYFDRKGRYVRFHNENAAKSCPGTSISKAQFMNEVKGNDGGILWYGVGSPHNTKNAIVKLQTDLTKLGFSAGTNGVMGPNTENAILEFQKKYDLKGKDGQAGKETLEIIKRELTPKVVEVVVNTNLRYGSRGPEVTDLQTNLLKLGYDITVGGAYGKEVVKAVETFQSRHKGVRRSGEVDETTAKMIVDDLNAVEFYIENKE